MTTPPPPKRHSPKRHQVTPPCVCATHNAQYYRVPAIFPIASTRASAKYTPYIATLFFTLPFFLTSSLPKETQGPSPEPDDRYQNQTTVRTTSQRTPRMIQSIDQLNWTRALISARRRIKSRPPREAPQTTTVRIYSQRTAVENNSNQYN